MTIARSPSGVELKTNAYSGFMGLDSSRDITAMDTGKDQHFALMENCFCDWRGQIVRDPGATQRTRSRLVKTVNFYNKKEVAWAEVNGLYLDLKSERGHTASQVFPYNANPVSTVFGQKAYFFARAMIPYAYDTSKWSQNQSVAMRSLLPAFATSVQRRLAVAGIVGRETQIHFSRADDDSIFPGDEPANSTNVLRASYIDIANILGTADSITGLGSFEQNRIVAFTSDRAIIYRVDPNIDNWVLDERANINVGCLSHNTIVSAGTDILFCSRSGVQSIRRSRENGILVYSLTLSDKIDTLYRALVASVRDPEQISAVYDQDEAQYHVFFPQPDNLTVRRLTLSLNPEGGEPQPKFSTGLFLNAYCGAALAGQVVFGTPGGLYNIAKTDAETSITPEAVFMTPLLWHGSSIQTKETHSILIQASGKGILTVEGFDDNGRKFGQEVIEINDQQDDNSYPDVPLSRQYDRKWEYMYRGARYKFTIGKGSGLVRVTGFAVLVKKK